MNEVHEVNDIIISKKSSRRKTLSHRELDEFLRESDNISVSSNSNVKGDDGNKNSVLVDNIGLYKKTKVHAGSPIPEHISTRSNSFSPVTEMSPLKNDSSIASKEVLKEEVADEESLIREFVKCKTGEQAIQIALLIYKTTNYPLIPTRIIHTSPIARSNEPMLLSTFESKKELLLSLAPSLQVAEKLRKDEEEERQAFTRCKVEKSSKKHSFYEYIDIDTKMTIRPEDYEMRYLVYINRHKSHALPPTFATSNATSNVTSTTQRTQKASSTHRRRRATLSPSSAKEMLLSVVSEDKPILTYPTIEESIYMDVEVIESTDNLTSLSVLPAQSDQTHITEEEIRSDMVSLGDGNPETIAHTLEAILNSPFITSDDKDLLDLDTMSNPFPSFFDDLDTDMITSTQSNSLGTSTNTTTTTTVTTSISTNISNTIKIEPVEGVEDRAFKRYVFRMQQAEWKYVWEVASAEAAMHAREKKG